MVPAATHVACGVRLSGMIVCAGARGYFSGGRQSAQTQRKKQRTEEDGR